MPNKREIESVISLPPNKRYEYTIKRVADSESLFVLGDESGLRTYDDGNGRIIFPVWPFEEFAYLCCKDEFIDCKPERIPLDDFMENYLPDFIEMGYGLSVLALPSDKGSIVEIDVFREDMFKELENYR